MVIKTLQMSCYVECSCGETYTTKALGKRMVEPGGGFAGGFAGRFVAELPPCSSCGLQVTAFQPLEAEALEGSIIQ